MLSQTTLNPLVFMCVKVCVNYFQLKSRLVPLIMAHNWATGQKAFIFVKCKSSQRPAVLQADIHTQNTRPKHTHRNTHTHTLLQKIQYQGHVSSYDLDLHPLYCLLFFLSCATISSVSSKAVFFKYNNCPDYFQTSRNRYLIPSRTTGCF